MRHKLFVFVFLWGGGGGAIRIKLFPLSRFFDSSRLLAMTRTIPFEILESIVLGIGEAYACRMNPVFAKHFAKLLVAPNPGQLGRSVAISTNFVPLRVNDPLQNSPLLLLPLPSPFRR